MKKLCVFVFCHVMALSLYGVDFSVNPHVGVAVFNLSGKEVTAENENEIDVAATKSHVVMPAPSVGLDMHITNELNGLTFTIYNNVAIPPAVFKKGGYGSKTIHSVAGIWSIGLMPGWTYGIKKPFTFRIGGGFGFTMGGSAGLNGSQKYLFGGVAIPAMYVSFQYCFQEHWGIHCMIYEAPHLSMLELPQSKVISHVTDGVGNTFICTFGVTWRK